MYALKDPVGDTAHTQAQAAGQAAGAFRRPGRAHQVDRLDLLHDDSGPDLDLVGRAGRPTGIRRSLGF